MDLTSYEHQILDLLVAGELEPLPALRAQLRAARVRSREYSGVGTFTEFEVPATCPRVQPERFTLSDVAYELEGVENGGGVVLFVREGRLTMLELFNWTDDWPDEPRVRSIHYLARAKPERPELLPAQARDIAELQRELARSSSQSA